MVLRRRRITWKTPGSQVSIDGEPDEPEKG
jgi:hypothetical protein